MMSYDINSQLCTAPHFWLTDMPVDYRSLESEENSAVPTASIIEELSGSATGELGGSSAAEGEEINCFDVDEALQGRQESGPRRTRFIWTDECHRIFVDAVNTLTLQRAVPRKILEYMRNCGVQNITRAIVASHLQKYRLNLKKSHLEVDKASIVPSQSISFNVTNQEENMKNQEDNMRNQEENLRNQEENMRNQENQYMRNYQEDQYMRNYREDQYMRNYQEDQYMKNQVLQKRRLVYEMTQQRWPLLESLSRPGIQQSNLIFPHIFYTNEYIHLQNLPNQLPIYVGDNNNYCGIPSPNQFYRYADGNNNNNVFASRINDGLSDHVSNNDPLYLMTSREQPVVYQEYDDDLVNIKPKV